MKPFKTKFYPITLLLFAQIASTSAFAQTGMPVYTESSKATSTKEVKATQGVPATPGKAIDAPEDNTRMAESPNAVAQSNAPADAAKQTNYAQQEQQIGDPGTGSSHLIFLLFAFIMIGVGAYFYSTRDKTRRSR